MSLKKKNSIFRSFASRLTIWYSVLFTILLIIIFSISYKILVSCLRQVVDRELLTETTEIEEEFYKEGLEKAKLGIQEGIEAEGKNRMFYRLFSSSLQLLVTSDLTNWNYLDFSKLDQWAAMSAVNETIYGTVVSPDKRFNVRIISRRIVGREYIVQVAKVMKDDQALAQSYAQVFGGSIFVLLVCGIALGWVGSRRAMSGVKRITQTARDIGREGINHRVKLGNEGEEIEELAQTFNTMLDRIEQLILELKDVTNNIAHDLRTPITRIRGLAETTLNTRNIENYQEVVGVIVEECDRLVHLINTMLEIAEADAGLKKFNKVPIDIVTLARQGYEIFLPVAQDKGIHLDFKSPQESLWILGNIAHLQRVISNLLDNAVKFTGQGGGIFVEVKEDGLDVVISIKDTGIGIDQSQQVRIFEKFYRVESSRAIVGNGLGLTFVKSIVSSLGGNTAVESVLGKGSTFVVKIPQIAS